MSRRRSRRWDPSRSCECRRFPRPARISLPHVGRCANKPHTMCATQTKTNAVPSGNGVGSPWVSSQTGVVRARRCGRGVGGGSMSAATLVACMSRPLRLFSNDPACLVGRRELPARHPNLATRGKPRQRSGIPGGRSVSWKPACAPQTSRARSVKSRSPIRRVLGTFGYHCPPCRASPSTAPSATSPRARRSSRDRQCQRRRRA